MREPVVAIILASGSGERLGYHIPKQFIKLAGKTVLEHTLDVFERHRHIDEIIIVTHPGYRELVEGLLRKARYRKITKLLDGGASRQQSSRIGTDSISSPNAKVLIHDAVRPFVSERVIDDCIRGLETHEAVDTAIPTADTIIRVDEKNIITSIPERKSLMRGQTPQGFRLRTIRRAHELAEQNPNVPFTDDCGIVVHFKVADVLVVPGDERNFKITYAEDVFLADKIFQLRAVEASSDPESLPSLAGKVVVIFGASKGIGLAIAERAKSLDARVYGFSRGTGLDITDHAQVESALARVQKETGRIDYVVNTAGVLRMGKIETRSMQDVEREIDINYTAAINIVRCSVPYLRETRGGLLLFTSSSYTRGRSLYSVYSSAKAAIVNLVQACSEETLDDGIRINAINPERTATPMRSENFGKEPEESLLRPEEVADVSIQTLASDLTGQVVYVKRAEK